VVVACVGGPCGSAALFGDAKQPSLSALRPPHCSVESAYGGRRGTLLSGTCTASARTRKILQPHALDQTQRPETHLHPAEDAEEGLERELSDDPLSTEIVKELTEHDDPEDRHRGCCYCARMRIADTWGGLPELEAMTQLLRSPIRVFENAGHGHFYLKAVFGEKFIFDYANAVPIDVCHSGAAVLELHIVQVEGGHRRSTAACRGVSGGTARKDSP